MTHYMRGLAASGLCLLAVGAWAQEGQPAPGAATTRAADARPTVGGELDAFIRHCVALGNHNEIKLAEFAQQKSQSPAVKQFAEKMIEDHGQFLQQIGGKTHGDLHQPQPGARAAATERDALRSDAESRPLDDPQRTTRRETALADHAPAGAARTHDDLRQVGMIEEQIAKQCLQSAERELGSKQGAEFEKCFFTMQVFMHQGMADKLQVLQEHASPELAQTLQQGLQKTQEHLQMAQQMLGQVDGTETARRTTRQE